IDTRLKAIEDQQQEILDRLDKPIDTQLTGSNVEEEVIFDGFTINDTSYHTKKLSEHINHYDLVIRNTTTTGIRVYIQTSTTVFPAGATRVFRGDGFGSQITFDIPGNGDRLIIPFNYINVRGQLNIAIKANETPEGGSFSLILLKG